MKCIMVFITTVKHLAAHLCFMNLNIINYAVISIVIKRDEKHKFLFSSIKTKFRYFSALLMLKLTDMFLNTKLSSLWANNFVYIYIFSETFYTYGDKYVYRLYSF